MAIIGKINDEVLIDDAVLRKPEVLTRWVDPTIKEKDKEIERLNNIINELEKWLNTQIMLAFLNEAGHYKSMLNKLKSLKEGKENDN